VTTTQETPETITTTTSEWHWVMTARTPDGRQGTTDNTVILTSGVDTRASVYREVLRAVKQWLGSDTVTVMFFDLQPNQL
jgi:hypothetical protein